MSKLFKYTILITVLSVAFTACKKQWDKRDTVTDPQLNVSLMEQIQAHTDLSVFAGYLTKTGYDKLLNSTKTFTVWAPNNQAMQAVDQSLLTDTAKLRQFVANHITTQIYLTNAPQPSLRIHTLIGKNVTFTASKVEDANIVKANQYVRNGVLHIIDKGLIPKQSIWEFINGLTSIGLKQKAYLQSQNYTVVDTSQATITGVDPVTGKPVLKPGTGVISKNHYFDNVADLSNEDKLYTYIVLTDNAYDTERSKVTKYFATSTADSTYNLSSFNVLKDLTFNNALTTAQLTDTVLSVNNVKVPVNKSNIVQTYNASNGIVYVMNNVPFRVQDKITPIYIQGENPSYFSRTDKAGDIFYRIKKDNKGVTFNDIYIFGGGANGTLPAQFYAAYLPKNLYSCQYKVYWRAINDVQTTAISQQLAFNTVTAATFPYTNVNPLVYDDVLLGNYTLSKFGTIPMYLIGANATASGTNSLILDYIKLVPVL
ncbi:fasciclin domain-containing protein [Mucilaginibacter robiniae]|uniref:Fasciclin domain-containing protein n=1 Tax=Mucilaginibacter robiniae TaxID=2728022 RepID=A0A7L5DYR1_9SPHI|nr:fasciclin domain-containing protein [Mucilaginibacter robiniae]QJD95247.1 fasciclin domain-containing protein [Mucilaginibacter robiniae]